MVNFDYLWKLLHLKLNAFVYHFSTHKFLLMNELCKAIFYLIRMGRLFNYKHTGNQAYWKTVNLNVRRWRSEQDLVLHFTLYLENYRT